MGEAEQETREVEIKAKEQLGLSHKITREARFMNGYEMCLLKRTEEGIPKMAAVIMEIEREKGASDPEVSQKKESVVQLLL